MIAIITVTEYPSMPGRHKWSAQVGTKRFYGDVPSNGPEAAAAAAVDVAIRHGKGNYTILGSKAVLDCIPPDIRNQRNAG